MAARKGPKKINKYSNQLKRTAVRLSQAPGVKVKDVAEALDIHPFMLSRWRKEEREGRLVDQPEERPKPKAKVKAKARAPSVVEITKYAKLKKQLGQLQKEHDFLKKFDRFRAQLRAKGSPSSRGSGDDSE